MAAYPYHRVLDVYDHFGRIGVMVEFGCDSGFLAEMKEFRVMMRDVTLQVAAQAPETVEQLLEQAYIKDGSKRVQELIDEISRHFGERVVVTRFVRWTTESAYRPFEELPDPLPAPALIQRVA